MQGIGCVSPLALWPAISGALERAPRRSAPASQRWAVARLGGCQGAATPPVACV